MRKVGWAVGLCLCLASAGPLQVGADQAPQDRARAINVVPPGQSGFLSLQDFGTATANGTNPRNFDDQLPLYAGWQYKPFQFEKTGAGSAPPNRPGVTIYRDQYGVPQLYAGNEDDLLYGMGYAMAHDRMFQMDVFRHVGHGTLAELTGASGIPMDVAVRLVSEGSAARMAEFNGAPAPIRSEGAAFAQGITDAMHEQCPGMVAPNPAPTCPAEYTLLATGVGFQIPDWTVDDTLAFGEYAGRFFGEFGHGELAAANTYLHMVKDLGSQQAAEQAFSDLYPLNDPTAPHIIPDAAGTFPRHLGPPVPSSFPGSAYANHDPSVLPPPPTIAAVSTTLTARELAVREAQRLLGLPRFGSNAIVVDGTKTADGNPILYSGPQTGWAVPGFFWEAELHDPQRDERGVTVPAIPLLVIGRNADSAWAVTSALDANADTFVDKLDSSLRYTHNGQVVQVTRQAESIKCNTPPATALVLPLLKANPPQPCPVTPTTVNVYVDPGHNNAAGLADPDAGGNLFVRDSSVTGHLVDSLMAWDAAGQQHDAAGFGNALSSLYLGFNFYFADARGEIAYFHTGKYPIRPANADPTLPMPGSGAYDWQGYESWADQPHVVNPPTHYLVNWNNKPARDWFSKSLESPFTTFWGPEHHVVPLDRAVALAGNLTLDQVGQVPRQVAYIDNPARVFMPYLLPVLQSSSNASLTFAANQLATWDQQRLDSPSHMLGAAPTFFDRWLEHTLCDVFVTGGGSPGALEEGDYDPMLTQPGGATVTCNTNPPGHITSFDNLATPTMKVESIAFEALLRVMRGQLTEYLQKAGFASVQAAVLKGAQDAAAELGSDTSKWQEPVEHGAFNAQGAGSVPDLVPLPNRGSYGQVVEPLAVAAQPASATPAALPLTTPGGPGGGLLVGVAAVAVGAWRRLRRRASSATTRAEG